MTKLVLYGTAGQGVKLLSLILANILKDQDYHIALTHKYSPLVRFGESNACLIFSRQKIENPLIEKADLEFDLKGKKLQEDLLKKSGDKKFMNMALLGMILKKLKLKMNEKELKKYLPKRFLEENLKAIARGYGGDGR